MASELSEMEKLDLFSQAIVLFKSNLSAGEVSIEGRINNVVCAAKIFELSDKDVKVVYSKIEYNLNVAGKIGTKIVYYEIDENGHSPVLTGKIIYQN
jgi:hypothetical protein